MLNPNQYANLILQPALKALDMFSISAMHLMLCTALVESNLKHLKQLPNGPALGLLQMEPETYFDVKRYLYTREDILNKVLKHCQYSFMPRTDALVSNLAFSAMMSRIKYWMIPEPLPHYTDSCALANYYELYYNGNPDVDKTEEFLMHHDNIETYEMNL